MRVEALPARWPVLKTKARRQAHRPHQVAAVVRAGAEVVVHRVGQWWERNRDNNVFVLLKVDYANASNEAEPEAFLGTACIRLPGEAKLAKGVARENCHWERVWRVGATFPK